MSSSPIRGITLEQGHEFPAEALEIPEAARRFFTVMGLEISPALAVIIVAAGCFFLGVIIASVMNAGVKGRRMRILAASPMAFLLTSFVWFPLMNGQLVQTTIAPIDAFIAMAVGDGELHNQLFLLGVVMLLGAMSLPIYELAMGLLQLALNLVRKALGPAAPEEPASPPATPEGPGNG